MSIELRVKSYCQECPNFKPTILQGWDFDSKKNKRIVVCESSNLCNNMERFIRNQIKNENTKLKEAQL